MPLSLAEDTTIRRSRLEAVLAFSIPILILLPFANKSYHIDDPLSLWTAKHILSDPIYFFDHDVNWTGVTASASLIIKNPPLAMYYMALVGAIAGWEEAPMHLAFFLFAGLTGFGAYLVARRLCDAPLLAAAIAMLSPAVLVSASNVMTTIVMVALYLLAMEAWFRALESQRLAWYAAAVGLIVGSTLSKYYGISLVPLLFAYTLAKQRRLGWWAAWLVVPILAVVGYEYLTRMLFGIGLFLDAGSYAQYYRANEGASTLQDIVIGLAYTGGCVLAPWIYAPLLGKRWTVVAVFLAAVIGVLVYLFWDSVVVSAEQSPLLLTPISGSIHFAVLGGAGAFVLVLAAFDLWKTRSPESLFLFLWVLGTFVFAAIVNWALNARSIMPMLIPAGILVARGLARRDTPARPVVAWIALAPVVVLSLLLAYADFRLANAARSAAHYFGTRYGDADGDLWFQGHWGWQYYIEQYGARHLESDGTTVQAGDIIVAPDNNMRTITIPPIYSDAEVATWDVVPWLTTWHYQTGAGYYSNTWGPLPYVFGRVPPERYVAYRVGQSATVQDPKVVAVQDSLKEKGP